FPDYIVCLEDGKQFKTLRRHLQNVYGMTPDDYRKRWGLPDSYPMVAPAYAEHRSNLAKSFGLGRKPVPGAAEVPAEVEAPAAKKRGRKVAEAAE
ncbi:MAG: MucR family transcriptional regulator, partial [Janthinobacterium lividum]